MCEAKMDPESPDESDKVVDMKSGTTTTTESPSSAASIKHCPLTPLTAGEDEEDEEEDEEPEEETEEEEEPVVEEDSERNCRRPHRHLNRTHHQHRRRFVKDDVGDHDDNLSSDNDDLISVGGSPSPSSLMMSTHHLHLHHHHLHQQINTSIHKRNHHQFVKKPEDEYFKPLKKLRMLKVESPTSQTAVGVKSFSISDILSHKPCMKKNHTTHSSSSGSSNSSSRTIDIENVVQQQQRIVRPWDPHQSSKSNGRRNSSDSSPLDALFQMTSKTFEGLNGHHESSEFGGQGNNHQSFNSRQPPKKKRKSRTAFTNHQIFELEKRFLYQKYLSPADRDEIAHQLGLTNAQVITWFQNRRAKLKRDLEEMKKDIDSHSIISTAHKTFLESAHDLALLKKRAQSQMDMSSAAAAAASSFHISSPTSSSQSSHSPINLTSESPPSTH